MGEYDMITETQVAGRRLMLAELNQMARVRLGGDMQRFLGNGQWSGILNKIDPSSPHCVADDGEARIWRDKAVLYLKGYLHGIEPTKQYAEYERAWEAHKERVNGHRFLAGACQSRFSERDKQEFIRMLRSENHA
jgi:hypothetical protein